MLREWELDGEYRATAGTITAGLDAAAVALNQMLGDVQAQAETSIASSARGALFELLEHAGQKRGIDAFAFIAHLHAHRRPVGSHLDTHRAGSSSPSPGG